jgi:hypothetical protein
MPMDRKRIQDVVLVFVSMAVLGYGATVVFPVSVRATEAQCCGLGSGTCDNPVEYCKTSTPCNCYPLTCLGVCVADGEGD